MDELSRGKGERVTLALDKTEQAFVNDGGPLTTQNIEVVASIILNAREGGMSPYQWSIGESWRYPDPFTVFGAMLRAVNVAGYRFKFEAHKIKQLVEITHRAREHGVKCSDAYACFYAAARMAHSMDYGASRWFVTMYGTDLRDNFNVDLGDLFAKEKMAS